MLRIAGTAPGNGHPARAPELSGRSPAIGFVSQKPFIPDPSTSPLGGKLSQRLPLTVSTPFGLDWLCFVSRASRPRVPGASVGPVGQHGSDGVSPARAGGILPSITNHAQRLALFFQIPLTAEAAESAKATGVDMGKVEAQHREMVNNQ